MHLIDRVSPPVGRFHLDVFRGGKLFEVVDEDNLVVDTSKIALAHLVAGASGYSISTFGIGTNGTAPATGNTSLTGSYTNAIGTASYPASNQVQFAFALGGAEANGMSIMEFGLLTSGGILFARKVRPIALTKTSYISFSGTWTLTF